MRSRMLLREKLGLSQEQLADYLKITRSQLSMYESGLRELPTPALTRLSAIEIFLYQPVATEREPRPHVKLHQAKAKKLLDEHIEELHYKLSVAQRKLEAIENIYSQKMLLLDTLDHLTEINKGSEEEEWHAIWSSLMEMNALEAIEQNSLHRKMMLQLHIKGLNHQYEHAMQLQQEMFAESADPVPVGS